jgi:CRISPR-associated endonuclease/helicase Cas3
MSSISYKKCPAKTFIDQDGTKVAGRSVLSHCHIVGLVARALIDRYPQNIRQALFPVGSEFGAACHDIGKVSPYFVEKLNQAYTKRDPALGEKIIADPSVERQWGGHAGVSQVTAEAVNAGINVPEVLGQHHGYPPNVSEFEANDEIFGGPDWHYQRVLLIEHIKNLLKSDWPSIENFDTAQLLSGLTSVADWIGSGEYFENPKYDYKENIDLALDYAGFIPISCLPNLAFKQVFNGFEPRAAQQQFIDLVTGPGVYILEAPMGIGKTEAALFAAYNILAAEKATGIYFALPTQLTSNKIFERFNGFLDSILHPDCQHRSLLLHSNAWLLKTDMGEDARPGRDWFNQSKRGLLAPFAVGTIDQALMAVIRVKHGFVRTFGLAGKVVILDEVHSYDLYTGAILDVLIKRLKALHCTVIILSATLTSERRQTFLDTKLVNNDYPLITACNHENRVTEQSVAIDDHQETAVSLVTNTDLAIEQALSRAERGEQVLWIENTVAEAQKHYLLIAARAKEIGVECGLLHSRFTVIDRQKNETAWVNLFGRSGWKKRSDSGRILVGTQVLEQSIDIDADFLISRFAPTDMLLQRIGRLWRHADTPRQTGAKREAWIIVPPLAKALANPESAFASTAFVYSPYVLCRSLEVWQAINTLKLPHDIRLLIEETYAPRQENGVMQELLDDLGKQASKMRQFALLAVAEKGHTASESKAQTRYGEKEMVEVLLIASCNLDNDNRLTQITFLDGNNVQIPWQRKRLSEPDWRKLSAALHQQIVKVPIKQSPRQNSIKELKSLGLHHCFYLGDQSRQEALLRVAMVDAQNNLIALDHGQVSQKYILEYRTELGFRALKKEN